MEGGRLIEVGAYYVFLSTNCNFILAKSFIEKQKLQHYPRKRNVSSNVFRLLKQWLVIKNTVVPLRTLHTVVSLCVFININCLSHQILNVIPVSDMSHSSSSIK